MHALTGCCSAGVPQTARVWTDKWVGIWFGDKHSQPLGYYLGIYFMLGLCYGIMSFFRCG